MHIEKKDKLHHSYISYLFSAFSAISKFIFDLLLSVTSHTILKHTVLYAYRLLLP